MPIVRFAWSPLLVDVRREQCPRAKWDRAHRAWTMTQAEADRFLETSHSRLNLVRESTEVLIDDARWIVGFVQGAPRVMPRQDGAPGPEVI
ncbi:MAG: hypothetical protein JO110_28670 [Acetobacteraceae bacterium]|nr:hypothetical protein [Acetobacteraceae bacterium]